MRKLSLRHRSIIERASISITQNRGKCGVIQNRGKCGVIHTNFSNELASHSPDTFLLYANKLDSMASSLESLMAHRRAKKAARSRGIINHNLTANHLNQHIRKTLMPVLMTYYLMLFITPLTQLSHANALAEKPNMPTFIWIILLLSTYPVALYLPTRYLSFHVDSLSALLHDISTGRKFQPAITTFLGACD